MTKIGAPKRKIGTIINSIVCKSIVPKAVSACFSDRVAVRRVPCLNCQVVSVGLYFVLGLAEGSTILSILMCSSADLSFGIVK